MEIIKLLTLIAFVQVEEVLTGECSYSVRWGRIPGAETAVKAMKVVDLLPDLDEEMEETCARRCAGTPNCTMALHIHNQCQLYAENVPLEQDEAGSQSNTSAAYLSRIKCGHLLRQQLLGDLYRLDCSESVVTEGKMPVTEEGGWAVGFAILDLPPESPSRLDHLCAGECYQSVNKSGTVCASAFRRAFKCELFETVMGRTVPNAASSYITSPDCVVALPRSPRDVCGKNWACWDGSGCIAADAHCNGVPDCADASDEVDCSNGGGSGCSSDEWACQSGHCVPASFWCDGVPKDCPDNSDEANCGQEKRCLEQEHECADGKCIRKSYLCDGFRDCASGEDESNCPNRPDGAPTTTTTTTTTQAPASCPLTAGICKCGRRRERGSARIVGGSISSPNSWPWLLELKSIIQPVGGGTPS